MPTRPPTSVPLIRINCNRQFALPYLTRAVTIARQAGVPIIVFALGADWALEELADINGADVIGIDWHTDAADARRRLDDRDKHGRSGFRQLVSMG